MSSDFVFIVEDKCYSFQRNTKISISSQVKEIALNLGKSHPGYRHIYKSIANNNCWFLFRDFLTVKELSNVTGCTGRQIRNRIRSKKTSFNLPVTREGKRVLIAFSDIKKCKLEDHFSNENRKMKCSLALQEKKDRIESYYNDGLPLNVIAKALGINRNTLVAFINKNMTAVAANERIVKIRRLQKTGMSLDEIANDLRIKVSFLNDLAKKGLLLKTSQRCSLKPPIFESEYNDMCFRRKIEVIKTAFFDNQVSLNKIAKGLKINRPTLLAFCEENIPEIKNQILLKRLRLQIIDLHKSGISPFEIAKKLQVNFEDLKIFSKQHKNGIDEILKLEHLKPKIQKYHDLDIPLSTIADALNVSRKNLKVFVKREMPRSINVGE